MNERRSHCIRGQVSKKNEYPMAFLTAENSIAVGKDSPELTAILCIKLESCFCNNTADRYVGKTDGTTHILP
jgi:hypothetical protein